jgi:energy-coupling factor transporter ATP-binding protein EcfA2
MSMTIDEMIARVPAWYMSSCERGGPSFHVTGPAGRGKSTLFEQFPQIMKSVDPTGDYGFVGINGLTITLPWLCGFMEMNVNESVGKKASSFSLPYWWFTKEGRPIDSYSGGLIFIDEEDKMQPEERKLTRDMKLAKRAGVHFLPDNWVVWSAGNPVGSRNGGTKTFDFIINSQVMIEVRDNTESWVKWAEKAGLLAEVITFAENNPQILFMDPPTIQGPYCTPRSLHQADIHLRSCMTTYGLSKIPLDVVTQGEIAGLIGKGEAEALFQHFRMALELPSYAECVAFPVTVKIPMEPDKLRLFTYKVADYAHPKDAPSIGILMERLPQEFQFMFVKMVRQRNARMLIEPEFRQWCKKNAGLIALIEGYERDHERRAS